MSGHRQAAVALYSLDGSDQRAILAELPDGDQNILRGLLAELAELGFDKAANSSDMRAPARAVGTAVAPATDSVTAELRSMLKRASPVAMVHILEFEPATLLAFFLSLERWPWAAQFMELLPPARRTLVREASRAGFSAAPARERFLLESAAASLADTPGAPVPASKAWFSTTLSKFAPWTR